MSGQVPYEEGQGPEEIEAGPEEIETGDDAREDTEHGEEMDISRLPSLLREGGLGRMDDRATTLDFWSAPPPHVVGTEFLRARRRVVAGGLAVVALAAVLGGVAGALLVGGPARGVAEPGAGEAVEALRGSIGLLASEVRSLKDGFGQGSQATAAGLAAIEQRIAGAETAQADLSSRIAGLSEARTAAGPAPSSVSNEITGSIAPPPLPVADDWILWRVRNGRALVQGAPGYFEVETGSELPGLGIVQRIVREDGRWVIYTPYAVIVSRG